MIIITLFTKVWYSVYKLGENMERGILKVKTKKIPKLGIFFVLLPSTDLNRGPSD